eukprot:Trichotokara_eunicae@DN8374_c0_g1_i1.p1
MSLDEKNMSLDEKNMSLDEKNMSLDEKNSTKTSEESMSLFGALNAKKEIFRLHHIFPAATVGGADGKSALIHEGADENQSQSGVGRRMHFAYVTPSNLRRHVKFKNLINRKCVSKCIKTMYGMNRIKSNVKNVKRKNFGHNTKGSCFDCDSHKAKKNVFI